jgi:hypothetical protein
MLNRPRQEARGVPIPPRKPLQLGGGFLSLEVVE